MSCSSPMCGLPKCAVCGVKCLGLVSFTETGRALCLGCRGSDAEWKRDIGIGRPLNYRFRFDSFPREHWHYGDKAGW